VARFPELHRTDELLHRGFARFDFVVRVRQLLAVFDVPFRASPLPPVDVLFCLLLQLLSLVGLHLPGVVEHLEAEDEHDDDGRVEGVDLRDEGSHAVAQQRRHDRHQDQGRDGAEKDRQFVVTHRKNGCV